MAGTVMGSAFQRRHDPRSVEYVRGVDLLGDGFDPF